MKKYSKRIMKRIGISVGIIIIFCSIVGCGTENKQDEVAEDIDNDYSVDYTDDYSDSYIEDEDNYTGDYEEDILVPDKPISFDGDIVLGIDCVLYLKSNGTIWGMGSNSEGQMGNGQRSDSYEWTQVEGIYDAEKICLTGDYFYALTTDGKLYHWGSNIFSPEEMSIFSNVVDISGAANENVMNDMIVTCEDGQQYVRMTARNNHEYFVPCDFENAQKIRISPNHTILLDGVLYSYIERDGVELTFIDNTICEQSFQEIYTMNEIPCDEKLTEGFGYTKHYFVGEDSTSVYEWKDGSDELINQGGSGIKKYVYWRFSSGGGNEYYLFYDGTISTMGENNFGQLGDGTNEDLWNNSWKIKGYSFNEMVCRHRTVCAIDDENNVWAWGEGFGNQPEIIISAEDFCSNY